MRGQLYLPGGRERQELNIDWREGCGGLMGPEEKIWCQSIHGLEQDCLDSYTEMFHCIQCSANDRM